ncbi:hypothetical protein ACFSKW_45470 [Nonomuraea mangrovi]|uniref:Uncharacterized protein n=1 Tax=Nonomuraea mangrovi TaxID=2316207 RepID=A0ABW4TAG0_9ACTN
MESQRWADQDEPPARQQERRRYARDGGGPTELALLVERDKLAAGLPSIQAAERAEHWLQQDRQQPRDRLTSVPCGAGDDHRG